MRLLALAFALPLLGASSYTWQFSNHRLGSNNAETVLTQSVVSAATGFGNVGNYVLDGYIYAQPLIAQNIPIGTSHVNLLVAVTMHNTAYGFNADQPTGAIWTTQLDTSQVVNGGQYSNFYNQELGCESTPVIDPSAGTSGVVYITCNSGSGTWKLYALNLADGSAFHAAATITGTCQSLTFVPGNQNQRTALLLLGGQLYFGFASYGDVGNFQGWIFEYSSANLTQTHVACMTNNGTGAGGGIWMSGGGLAVDDGGRVCFSVGNGTYDGTSANLGESFVCLNADLTFGTVNADTATPSNYATLNTNDWDVGSVPVFTIPGYVMGGTKKGLYWVLASGAMGGLQGTGPGPAQTWQVVPDNGDGGQDLYSGVAFDLSGNRLFAGGTQTAIYNYSWGGATFNVTATANSSSVFNFSPALAFSSNGTVSGSDILWAMTNSADTIQTPAAGTLRAFKPSDMSQLFSASIGNIAKFVPPVPINGKVYVATGSNTIQVFGTMQTSPAIISGAAGISGSVAIQ